jgi:asparagine synthase (glutamine-hydrolysing)
MCGIAGLFHYDGADVFEEDINLMLEKIAHRGPDGSGVWTKNNLGLGHRLLKIQDISDNSNQPYKYRNLVMIFNGEIYNYPKLRADMGKMNVKFDTEGDTEVLIKAFYFYGIDETLTKIVGCFAIALYDKISNKLYVIRDRHGIKPLHYYEDEDSFIFASEIKSILTIDKVKPHCNYETVAISLACRLWMDTEKTLFKNIYTVLPGSYMIISENGRTVKQYYEMKYTNSLFDEGEIIKKFNEQMEVTIKQKLLSKVPIAAFLSGGIDSSLICKMVNNYIESPLHTYTICYNNDNDYDLNHANELASKEGFVQHNILIDQSVYTLDNIDKIIYHVEEVLIDKVYLPVYFNYKAAREDGFIVILNGQGADEIWLGYIFNWGIYKYLDKDLSMNDLIDTYYKENTIFGDKLKPEFQLKMKKALEEYLDRNLRPYQNDTLCDKLNEYSIMSIRTILHNLLMQEDKLSMAHSVESRVPFVDNHSIVELSLSIPSNLKVKDGREKYILRDYSKSSLPQSIISRKKYPFPEPPNSYNETIDEILTENWAEIKKSVIFREIIEENYLCDISSFSDLEKWWILVYWRFERVFDLGGQINA